MIEDQLQLSPEQLLKHTKKHPHTHTASAQAFAVNGKDIVIHNISMKGDPQEQFDCVNYRRGLTFMQEIVDFVDGDLRVARKGLRKFYDLLPEYLGVKNSYISTSKHHLGRKDRLLSDVKKYKGGQFTVYNMEKANGENLQISYDSQCECWIIGSKNKTLLLNTQKDLKYIKHKHEHVLTKNIAEHWFKLLASVPNEQNLKKDLSNFTLIGEHCDSVKNPHIVDYGAESKLVFYALVEKQNRDDNCLPTSALQAFLERHELSKNCVKCEEKKCSTVETLFEYLRQKVCEIYQKPMEEEGEGVVLYICGKNEEHEEKCLSVSKVKTLQYKIIRKLREKLKMYLQKFKKTYEKILNKFIDEVKELTKGFNTPKPLEFYFEMGRRAFELCQQQTKNVNKFIHNKFIMFMKIVNNHKINRAQFMEIVNSNANTLDTEKFESEEIMEEKMEEKIQKENQKIEKKVLIFIPITIPSTGKSSLFRKVREFTKIPIQILSSDTVREQVMMEKMKKSKTMTKKQAFQKSGKQSNERYYNYMGNILKKFSQSEEQNSILVLDKNHPDSALKPVISELKSRMPKNLKAKIIGVIPEFKKQLYSKGKYKFPFSSCYIATCLKRLLSRGEHETLEGSEEEKSAICLGFANLFRNFSLSEYNLSKYFNGICYFPFHNDVLLPEELENLLLKIILGTKPGSFEPHSELPDLIKLIKMWQNVEGSIEMSAQISSKRIMKMFERFEQIKVEGYTEERQKKE